MTNDPLGGFRDELLEAGRHQPRRSRRALLVGGGVFALLAAVAAGVVWRVTDESDDRADVVVADDPTTTSTDTTDAPATIDPVDGPPQEGVVLDSGTLPAGPVWTIQQPSGWRRINEGGALQLTNAPQMPDTPMDCASEYGRDHVHLFIGFPETTSDLPPRPEAFDESTVPETTAGECIEEGGNDVRGGRWESDGTTIDLLVVFGPDVTPDTRNAAWEAASSLRQHGGPPGPPVCVTTSAPDPGIQVPSDWPERPTSGVWWGTPDLWTALPTDGTYPPRKSVWWSQNFPGGAVEEKPDVWVSWEQVDGTIGLDNGGYGTNAHTPEEGWFMIAGGDPPAPGCWQVTATYKGAMLSYVYWLEPTIWIAPQGLVDPEREVTGRVTFNASHSCVLLDDGGEALPVAWPLGTTIADDGSIELADGRRIRLGQQLVGEGEVGPPRSFGEYLVPEICVPDASGEIVALDSVTSISG